MYHHIWLFFLENNLCSGGWTPAPPGSDSLAVRVFAWEESPSYLPRGCLPNIGHKGPQTPTGCVIWYPASLILGSVLCCRCQTSTKINEGKLRLLFVCLISSVLYETSSFSQFVPKFSKGMGVSVWGWSRVFKFTSTSVFHVCECVCMCVCRPMLLFRLVSWEASGFTPMCGVLCGFWGCELRPSFVCTKHLTHRAISSVRASSCFWVKEVHPSASHKWVV